MTRASKIYTILREPLFHFLLIGAGLFLIYAQMNDTTSNDDKYINVTKSDLERLSQNWIKSNGRAPSDIEKQELIDSFIQEEILFREAVHRGLDKDDSVIRRHLVKKMRYIFDDNAFIPQATDEQLQEYLSKNSAKFIEPASISFNQVVFTKNDTSSKDANEFLKRLHKSSSNKISTVGDLVKLSKKGISNTLGEEFATEVFNLPIQRWTGPINSKHGVHLIYIHSRASEEIPKLSEIKKEVQREWHNEQRQNANDTFYRNLLNEYDIVIDEVSSKELSRE